MSNRDIDPKPQPDLSTELLQAAGLTCSATDLAGVRALRARFAGDRGRLASLELRDVEPLPIILLPATASEGS